MQAVSDYVRFSRSFTNNELIPFNSREIWGRIKEHPEKDHYISLYNYKDHHVEKFAQTHSVEGITDVTTNQLLWDFDSRQLEEAQRDTKELCARLLEQGVPEDKVQVFFSGNKGFHVQLMIDESLTRQQFRNMTFNLAKGLTTFDVRINDEPRVIRAPLTKHPESGLYKIPITIENLNTLAIGDIKVMATDIKNHSLYNIINEKRWKFTLPKEISALKSVSIDPVSTIKLQDIKGFVEADLDFTQCPKWMSRERYALKEGYFYGSESVNTGERNIAFMILAATYRNQGFSQDETLGLLEITAQKQAKRTGEEVVTTERLYREVVSAVYSAYWKGGIYGKDEPLLIVTRNRFNIMDTDTPIDLCGINEVGLDFMDYAKNIDKNTVKTGLKSLDESVLITSGMMVALLAAPGAGKTSFANMFVENLSVAGENTLYFSLDMYKNLLFTRLLQKYSGYPMKKIFNMYKDTEPDSKLAEAYSAVVANYNNVFFNFRSGPTVEEIEQEVINYKETSGKQPKLVVVDYLEKVKGPFSDATANSGYVASRLSDIAKRHHLVVLLLVQPQKSAGDPSDELTSYRRIKGASVIEQDSRVILTLSRPGYNPKAMENDNYASISVVKNNMGGLCSLDYCWDGVTGSLTEMTSQDRSDLKKLREDVAKRKAEEQRGYGNI
jgi:replicative DNA helicase